MNDDPRIDADTAERILAGHDADQPELHELLADATAAAYADELAGEEAAVAAFHTNRRPITHPAATPRIPAIKAALIALLLTLIGGTTLAATAHHLPFIHHHAPRPAMPTATSHHTPPATSRPAPNRLQVPLHHRGHHKPPHPPHPNKKNKSKSQQQPAAHKYKTHKNVPARAKK